MKRFIAILSFGFLANTSQAQVGLGFEVGATYNTLKQVVKGTDRNAEGQFGYRLGFNTDITFGEYSNWHLQPAAILDFNSGSKTEYRNQTSTGSGIPVYEFDKRAYNITTVNVPIYLIYKFGDPLYDDQHFFVGAGPSFSYTAGGRFHQVYSNALNDRELVIDNDLPIVVGKGYKHDYARFNVGASAILGYEFKNAMYIKGYYTINFMNMAPQAELNNKLTSCQAGITFGYFFKTFARYY